MKLSQDQIQDLFSFVRKHYVEHYDLQTELVDHLANGIETQLKLQPSITFQEATKKEFNKFGIHGFEDVIRKRTQAMEWRYWKIIFKFYKEFFRLPKVVFTLASIMVLTFVLGAISFDYKYDCIIGVLLLIPVYVLFMHFRKQRDNELEQVKYGKKWMLKDCIYNFGYIFNFIYLIPIVLNVPYFRNWIPMDNLHVDFVFAALIICMTVLVYVTIFIIPKKAEELLSETYPEYKMVN